MRVRRPAEHCFGPPANSTPTPPEQVEKDLDLPPREPELPVWRSSLSSWFQSDVDAFFHAVSVYSRWRPDLIADAVKTKSEVEVVEFLITLDSCTSPRETETGQGIREIAPTPPAAIEVSDEWVAAEEAMAAAIAADEEHVELQELETLRGKRVRDTEVDMIQSGKRRRITAEVGTRELMVGKEHDEDEDVEDVNAGKARFEEWHTRKIAAWKREDLLRKLEDVHLQVLDAILRGDAEAQKEKGLRRESADAPDPDIGVDLKALSPMSRRRLTKRLYMRRKRAQLRGEAEVTVGLERIKPGRKVGGRGKEKEKSGSVMEEKLPSENSGRGTPMTTEFVESLHSDDDVLEDVDGMTAKKPTNAPGKRRYQKVRDEFENAGIDASYLRKYGMDLFHYGPLGKLVGIFKPLMQCPEDDTSASYISADLAQYLRASIVAFTTDVVHRAILWKEQANELKGQKKVWRGALHEINQAAVENALKMVGVGIVNKQEYFSKFLDHYDPSRNEHPHKRKSSSPAAADAKGDQSTVATHSPGTQSSQHETRLSPHRALYTPAFLTPAAFNIGVVDTFFSSYDACFPSKARIGEDSRQEIEDPLLSDETDEEALEDELREDEILDHADLEIGKKFEEQLWAEVEREERADTSVASE